MSCRIVFRIFFVLLVACELIVGFNLLRIDSSELVAAREAIPEDIVYLAFLQNKPAVTGSLFVVHLIAFVIGVLGVFLFKRWGRWFYVCSYALMLILPIIIGPTIDTGIEMAFWQLFYTANGALILAMFLPPVGTEFNKLS